MRKTGDFGLYATRGVLSGAKWSFDKKGKNRRFISAARPQNQTADPFPRSHKPFGGFILRPDRRLKPSIKCHVIILGILTLTYVIPYKYHPLIIFYFYHSSTILKTPNHYLTLPYINQNPYFNQTHFTSIHILGSN